MEEINLEKTNNINENNSQINFSLDEIKEKVKQKIYNFGLKIKKENTNKFLKQYRDELCVKIRNVNPVTKKEDKFNTIVTKFSINEIDKNKLKEKMNEKFKEINLNEEDYEITEEEIELNYDNFLYGEILKKMVPELIEEVPSSFEAIGKIAHLNLREKFLPYKNLIGKLILDKNSSISTVINKTSQIDNVFRTYDMEVLAGESNFEVVHREGSCSFTFDIRKVYWCSRLQAERERLIKKFKKGEVLCDAFCGVGPLAIRTAKAGIRVLANDLNPNCYEYLNVNIKKNKIDKKLIDTFNMDARDFIRTVVDMSKHFKDEEQNFDNKFPVDLKVDHFYMNLPKDALEFLDVFVGLFNNTKKEIYNKNSLPIVHVYGFSNARNPKEDLFSRIAVAFKIEKLDESCITDFHNVRDVSNNKHMFCISIRIPAEVAYN